MLCFHKLSIEFGLFVLLCFSIFVLFSFKFYSVIFFTLVLLFVLLKSFYAICYCSWENTRKKIMNIGWYCVCWNIWKSKKRCYNQRGRSSWTLKTLWKESSFDHGSWFVILYNLLLFTVFRIDALILLSIVRIHSNEKDYIVLLCKWFEYIL